MGMGTGRAHSKPKATTASAVCIGFVLFLLVCLFSSFGSKDRCSLSSHDPATTKELDLKHCTLVDLPASIAKFTSLVKLDVSHNSLLTLPALPASIETLFALGNAFEMIPPAVAALPSVRMLSFKSCRLRAIGDAPLPTSLHWLILTDNQLTSLPESIGRLTRMRKFMLANNKLASLPASMSSMRELELLRLANNALGELPAWLLSLPNLTWLAVAGNPCVANAPARAALAPVRYEDLVLGEKLGEGTSSIVRKGEWKGSTVAVKVYKAQLSSDGKNIDEVRASCAVDHPNVLRWLGERRARRGGVRTCVGSPCTGMTAAAAHLLPLLTRAAHSCCRTPPPLLRLPRGGRRGGGGGLKCKLAVEADRGARVGARLRLAGQAALDELDHA